MFFLFFPFLSRAHKIEEKSSSSENGIQLRNSFPHLFKNGAHILLRDILLEIVISWGTYSLRHYYRLHFDKLLWNNFQFCESMCHFQYEMLFDWVCVYSVIRPPLPPFWTKRSNRLTWGAKERASIWPYIVIFIDILCNDILWELSWPKSWEYHFFLSHDKTKLWLKLFGAYFLLNCIGTWNVRLYFCRWEFNSRSRHVIHWIMMTYCLVKMWMYIAASKSNHNVYVCCFSCRW